jgi:hypothetical protein
MTRRWPRPSLKPPFVAALPLLAVGLLAVVVVGGVAIGMIHAFSEEIGLDW